MMNIHNILIPDVPLTLECEIKDLSDDDMNHCVDILFKNCEKVYINIILPTNITKKIYIKNEFLNLFYNMKKNNIGFQGVFWNSFKYDHRNKLAPNKSFVFGIANSYSIRINNKKHKHAYYLSKCIDDRLLQNDKLYLS